MATLRDFRHIRDDTNAKTRCDQPRISPDKPRPTGLYCRTGTRTDVSQQHVRTFRAGSFFSCLLPSYPL